MGKFPLCYAQLRIMITEGGTAKRTLIYLHDADDGAAAVGEILDGGDDVGGVEEGLGVGGDEHVEAHGGDGRARGGAGDGEPNGEVAGGALGGPGEEDEPGAAAGGGGGGEGAGEDADVGADVLEEGDGVEGRLVVALARLQRRRVRAEAVRAPRRGLDPRARRRRRPPRPPPPHRRRSSASAAATL